MNSEATSVPKPPDFICSLASLNAGEAMLGSAPQVHTWLLLEYRGTWGYHAFEESDITDAVKDHLNTHLTTKPKTKLLLIKQSPPRSADGIAFYVVKSDRRQDRLYQFQLKRYEDLLDFDLDGDFVQESAAKEERLYLVCTNGLRDRCCAREGTAAYNALQAAGIENGWQSTHLGSHRFAGNLLCLPHGLYYGRVNAENAVEVANGYAQGRIALPQLRGRASYGKAEQAAEGLLLEALDERRVDGLRLISSQVEVDNIWAVEFEQAEAGIRHKVRVRWRESGEQSYSSCSGGKQHSLGEFELAGHEMEESAIRQ